MPDPKMETRIVLELNEEATRMIRSLEQLTGLSAIEILRRAVHLFDVCYRSARIGQARLVYLPRGERNLVAECWERLPEDSA